MAGGGKQGRQNGTGGTAGGASPANIPYSAWRFTTTAQEPKKKPSRFRKLFAFLDAFRVRGTDTTPGRLWLYTWGLAAGFLVVYAVCFAALYIPLRTATARLPFDLSFGLGALGVSLTGGILCCLCWFPLKRYRRLIAPAYGRLTLLALLLFGAVLHLSWEDTEARQIVVLFFARYTLFPLLLGGSIAVTVCLWDWMREQERARKLEREMQKEQARRREAAQKRAQTRRRTSMTGRNL